MVVHAYNSDACTLFERLWLGERMNIEYLKYCHANPASDSRKVDGWGGTKTAVKMHTAICID